MKNKNSLTSKIKRKIKKKSVNRFFLFKKIYYQLFFFIIYIRYFFVKPKDIAIAVTTSKNYFDKTIPKLIKRFSELGFDLNKVYVFEGGYKKNEKIEKTFNHYRVDHNSFDLTALISILDLKIDNEKHWLLLHDTLHIKKSFKYIIATINPDLYDCMPLRDGQSMNIGIYSHDFIIKNEDYIVSVKNMDYSTEGIQKSKYRGVLEEDYLFKNSKNSKIINKILYFSEHVESESYFGTIRSKETYPQLGIVKYKANFKKADNWIVDL
jgi:hypothetical protein